MVGAKMGVWLPVITAKAAILALGLAMVIPVFAADPTLPDPKLSPGAFAENTTAAICARGSARAHRVWHRPPIGDG